jgi:DNA-binding transcriptional LysR family regulator
MFDWNDLKHFLAVARHGSTLAAAKALNVNQSTVHRRLDELETRLGRRLVMRQSTGYKLTELGKDVVAFAERVEEAAQALERHLLASDTELSGTVRVTCPEVLGLRLLRSQLVERFRNLFPGLRVEMIVTDKYVDLAKGEADIALRACAPQPSDPHLFGRKISSSPWGVYAARAYVDQRGGIDQIEEIDRHAVIHFEGTMTDHPAARWLDAVAPRANVSARVSGVPAGLTAVKSGIGVGVLPVIVGDNERDLVRLYGPIPNLPSDIYLLIHEDMKETPRVRAFFDFIVSERPAVRHILEAEPAVLIPGTAAESDGT